MARTKKRPQYLKSARLHLALVVVASAIAFLIYTATYTYRMLPRVYIGTIPVGNLTRAETRDRLQGYLKELEDQGIRYILKGETGYLDPVAVDLELDKEQTLTQAWSIGRRPAWQRSFVERLEALGRRHPISPVVTFDEKKLRNEIANIALSVDRPVKNIRLHIDGRTVTILADTASGWRLDREGAEDRFAASFRQLGAEPIRLKLVEDPPRIISIESAKTAKREAERMIASSLTLRGWQSRLRATSELIGSWVTSGYAGTRLYPKLDDTKISAYVVDLAQKLDAEPTDPTFRFVDGKVVDFRPPKAGRILQQAQTIASIIHALNERRRGSVVTEEITLPMVVKKPVAAGTAADLGIQELIGTATTPFTGSPKNRIANIMNGTKFLSGVLIKPGEEFSVVGALGTIDNTTGYLPELVIKGNRTIPEFGGGLCQVSTTLFRAALDTGLPITARQNHSYRVPYYERDGEGNYIGPGLDATIYSPNPDLRFENDTQGNILVFGRVDEDAKTVTFEFYGTPDGRIAEIDGPRTLTVTSPGEPIYVETDALPEGTTRKLEDAHPGGVAIATYTVTYPDGAVKEEVFKSYYRRWPARFLVGTRKTP